MRSFLVAAALAFAGCTAVDDFGKFHVGGDAAVDLTPVPSGAFGEPCNMMTQPPCEHGPGTFTLTCHTELPGTMCTRVCDPAVGAIACSDYGQGRAACAQLPPPSGNVCMPTCHNPFNAECPPGYNCCSMGGVTSGPGACVPATLCH